MLVSKVFLSHSSADKAFVDRLASDLERVNVGVWYDKWEIRVGDLLIEKIEQGIKSNDYLAIVLSPSSVASPNKRCNGPESACLSSTACGPMPVVTQSLSAALSKLTETAPCSS